MWSRLVTILPKCLHQHLSSLETTRSLFGFHSVRLGDRIELQRRNILSGVSRPTSARIHSRAKELTAAEYVYGAGSESMQQSFSLSSVSDPRSAFVDYQKQASTRTRSSLQQRQAHPHELIGKRSPVCLTRQMTALRKAGRQQR